MSKITLTLTFDEANLILDGLGRMPFAKVYALVGKIQQQAKAQIGNGTQNIAPIPRSAAPSPAPSIEDIGAEVEHDIQ